MPIKDLHQKPFDEGTLAKLKIFEDYAQAWLPTFIMSRAHEIHIFDFFAGPGYDMNNVPGSPIRLMNKIDDYTDEIFKKKTKIVLHLNEFEPRTRKQIKYQELVQNCSQVINEHPKFSYFLTVKYYNRDAGNLFFELLPLIEKYPSLVYLDQNGVKFISEEYLNALNRIRQTDFLFFVSSSHFKWLGTTETFSKVLRIEKEELDKTKYSGIHRFIVEKLKKKLGADSELKLFPFSIKKGSNIYGLIFGASDYRAVDKFLDIAWKKNVLNGEADFDIDGDLQKGQYNLFETIQPTKIEKFENDLRCRLLNKTIRDNSSALIFTYEQGHPSRHANDLLRKLKKERMIDYEGATPGIKYKYVFKSTEKRHVDYKIKKP